MVQWNRFSSSFTTIVNVFKGEPTYFHAVVSVAFFFEALSCGTDDLPKSIGGI